MLRGEVDCLVWVERMTSMLDMKIVEVLVSSLIAISCSLIELTHKNRWLEQLN